MTIKEKTLINEEYLKQYSCFPKNYNLTEVENYIKLSELIWIKPILGDTLYEKLLDIVERNDINEEYSALLLKIYPLEGFAVTFEALPFVWANISEVGITLGDSENSNSVSLKDMDYINKHLKAQIQVRQDELKTFISSHYYLYPEYNVDCDCKTSKTNAFQQIYKPNNMNKCCTTSWFHSKGTVTGDYVGGKNIDITNNVISVTGITVPTKVSQLENDADYLKEADFSEYAKKTDIPTKVSAFENDANYLTQHQRLKTLNGQSLVGEGNIVISGDTDLTDYYTKEECDNKFLSEADFSEYAKKSDLTPIEGQIETLGNTVASNTANIAALSANTPSRDYIERNYQPKGNYALKTEVPTKLSDLQNDLYSVVDMVGEKEDGSTITFKVLIKL